MCALKELSFLTQVTFGWVKLSNTPLKTLNHNQLFRSIPQALDLITGFLLCNKESMRCLIKPL